MMHVLIEAVRFDFNVDGIKIFIYVVSGSMNYIKLLTYAFNKHETCLIINQD